VSNKRLGKGLEALIRPLDDSESPGIIKININDVQPNPHQPRKQFNEETLAELVESIKMKGVITPITVLRKQGKFVLIAGERRLRAAKLAGLDSIPAYFIEVSDDADMMEISLVENIQRENLNPIEEAEAFAVLKSKFKLSLDVIAKAVGKNRATISNSLRLLNLPKTISRSLRSGEISAGHGRAILMAKTQSAMMALWQKIIKNDLSVRVAETLARAKQEITKAQSKPSATIPVGDPVIQSLENELIKLFGTKVKIRKTKKGGVIEVSYFSDDDFERIFALIKSVETK
jgi:ParB family chromosome partitioning protein